MVELDWLRWRQGLFSIKNDGWWRSGIVRQLTWKTRLMSASLSPDGKTIAAVENTSDNRNNLILFDIKSNKITRSVPAPGNASLKGRNGQLTLGNYCYFINRQGRRNNLIQAWKPGMESLPRREQGWLPVFILKKRQPFFRKFRIRNWKYLCPFTGEKTSRLTNSRFGATDVTVSGNRVLFCDYSSSGNDICSLNLKYTGIWSGKQRSPGLPGRKYPLFLKKAG